MRDLAAEHGRRGLLRSCCSEQARRLRAPRPGRGRGCFLHNTRYDFNDDVLPLGAALFAALVERDARRQFHAQMKPMRERRFDDSACGPCCRRAWPPRGVSAPPRRRRPEVGDQGDVLSMDPHSLNETLAAQLHRQHLRAAGGPRQEARAGAGARHRVEADVADRLALQPAQERQVPRRHAVHRRRRDLLVPARRADGSDVKDLRRARSRKSARSTTTRSTSITNAPFPILPDAITLVATS